LTFDDDDELNPFNFPNLAAKPRNNNCLQELQDSYMSFSPSFTTSIGLQDNNNNNNKCGEPELVNLRLSTGNRSPQTLYQVFFTDKTAGRKEIVNERFIDRYFSSMNLSIKFTPMKW